MVCYFCPVSEPKNVEHWRGTRQVYHDHDPFLHRAHVGALVTTKTNVRILDQRTPDERDRPFLPGMGRTWLLPLYDLFTRSAGVHALHERAVELAGIGPRQTVVDVGCGTGNLSLAVLAAQPDAVVTGLDPDRAALRRAARKARRRGLTLTLVQGYADRIPAQDASLDHLVSSLALHHVDDDGRDAFAHDALRALRPGGTVTIVDIGGGPNPEDDHHHAHGPAHALRHLPSLLRSRLARNPAVARNLGDGVVALFVAAGFADVREVDHVDHRFGPVTYVQATRPDQARPGG
jgi:SAM-dependent methyltransferase